MTLRIAICQKEIPHYRAPFFNLLGRQSDIQLSVYHGQGSVSALAAGRAETFESVDSPVSEIVYPVLAQWHAAHLDSLNPNLHDVVIAQWDAHYASLWPAILKSSYTGVPLVLWGHGRSKHQSAWREAVRLRLGRSATAILLYSKTVADHLVQERGFESARVFVAQNALDQNPIQEARRSWLERPQDLNDFAQRHRLDPTRTIIFVSRLIPENRVDILIRAFEQISREEPTTKLVIVGRGPEEESLKMQVAASGLDEKVIFGGAIYSDMELAPWMLNSTLFCYPENIGLSLLHAFGFGLPVVTSDDVASHNPEIEALVPGENGLTYRHGDANDLARQCLRLMRQPSLRSAMSERALSTVLERYTLDTMARGFIDVARFVAGRTKAA